MRLLFKSGKGAEAKRIANALPGDIIPVDGISDFIWMESGISEYSMGRVAHRECRGCGAPKSVSDLTTDCAWCGRSR